MLPVFQVGENRGGGQLESSTDLFIFLVTWCNGVETGSEPASVFTHNANLCLKEYNDRKRFPLFATRGHRVPTLLAPLSAPVLSLSV